MRAVFFFSFWFMVVAVVSSYHSDSSHRHGDDHKFKNDNYETDKWASGVYTYQVDTRTLTQVRGQWVGVRMRGKLTLEALQASPRFQDQQSQSQNYHHQDSKNSQSNEKQSGNQSGSQSQQMNSDSQEGNHGHYRNSYHNQDSSDNNSSDGKRQVHLVGQLKEVLYAYYKHVSLPNGPRGSFPDDLKYKPYPELEQPFIATMRGGLIESLNVSSSMSNSDANLLKGLLSSLQYDTSDRNLVGNNNFLNEKDYDGVYNKMEIDVTGKCKVKYAISQLPLDELQRDSSLAHIIDPSKVKPGRLLAIAKSNDYSYCKRHVAYHFGMPQYAEWKKPSPSGRKENIIYRNVVSKIIADRRNNTVYSAISTQEVHVKPVMYNDEKSTVHSSVNMTLRAYDPQGKGPSPPKESRPVGNLIYSSHMRSTRDQDSSETAHQGSYSASSEEHGQQRNGRWNTQNNRGRRTRRSNSSHQQNSSSEEHQNNQYETSKYSWEKKPDSNSVPATMISKAANDSTNRDYMVKDAIETAKEVAHNLQNPNQLVEDDPLTKWNRLASLLRVMSKTEISQVTDALWKSKGSTKSIAKKVYRDALVQAGSQPAYNEIKDWINTDRIKEEEAAQAVAHLPNALRYPTEELMKDFFYFASGQKVRKQRALNTTAILAATKFIYMAHVNNHSAHYYYPAYFYGRLADEEFDIVQHDVLPYLRKQLESAVNEEDAHKAQVYVKALGNLGHPAILEVFAPYMEGKVNKVTKHLKRFMIANYARVSQLNPKKARPSLYNIYKNTAEDYEVRVAAVFQLMHSMPSAAMLQQMAAATHNDPSEQVRSAIKTAIRSASKLDNPQYRQLAKNAGAAKHLVSDQKYGYQSSGLYMRDSDGEENYDDSFHALSYVGSDDHIIPKSGAFTFRTKLGGFLGEQKISASVSSVADIVNAIKYYYSRGSQSRGPQRSGKHHAAHHSDNMPIKSDNKPSPLEANVLVQLMNQQRFFAVGESYIKNLVQNIDLESDLKNGIQKNYTKIFNKVHTEVYFPLITGNLFHHSFRNPVAVTLNASISAQVQREYKFPAALNISSEIQASYSYNYDGRVGFYSSLGDKSFTSGVEQRLTFNIPLEINVDVDLQNKNVDAHLKIIDHHNDQTIYKHKIATYTTARRNKDQEVPSQHPKTKYVESSDYTKIHVYGEDTIGMAFKVNRTSENRHPNNTISSAHDLMDRIFNPFSGYSFDNEELSVKYKSKRSSTKKMKLSVEYSSSSDMESSKDESNKQWRSAEEFAQQLQEANSKRDNKIEKSMQYTARGIRYAHTDSVKVAARFHGKKHAYYNMTVTRSTSKNGKKMQYSLWNSNEHVNGKTSSLISVAIQNMTSSLYSFNAEEALNSKPKGELSGALLYINDDSTEAAISGKIEMKESSSRNRHLRSKPEAQKCRKEMAEQNNLMPACQSVFFQALTMDRYKVHVKLNKFGQQAQNFTNKIMNYVRHHTYDYLKENWVSPSQPENDRIDAEVRLEPDFSMLNVTINGPKANIHLRDYPVNPDVTGYLAVREQVPAHERWAFNAFQRQLNPYCTVDRSQINTFSNLTYNYELGECWHVVMTAETAGDKRTHILMKNPGPGRAEVIVITNHQDSREITVRMDREGVQVDAGKRKVVSEGHDIEEWDEQHQNRILKVSGNGNNMLVEIGNNALYMYFDGDRLYLTSSQQYRNKTRGICGGMSGWKGDLVSTDNCYMSENYLTAASWIADNQCEHKYKQAAIDASKKSCVSRDYYRSSIYVPSYYGGEDNRFEDDNNNKRNEKYNKDDQYSHDNDDQQNKKKLRETKLYQPRGENLQRQHQFYEENDKICVTTRPLPACPNKEQRRQLTQIRANVICKNKNDKDLSEIKNQIKNGEDPTHNLENKQKANNQAYFSVPLTCED